MEETDTNHQEEDIHKNQGIMGPMVVVDLRTEPYRLNTKKSHYNLSL